MSDLLYETRNFAKFSNDMWKTAIEPFYSVLSELKRIVDSGAVSEWFDDAILTSFTESNKDQYSLLLKKNNFNILTLKTYWYSSYYGMSYTIHTLNSDFTNYGSRSTVGYNCPSYMNQLTDIHFNDRFLGFSFESRYGNDNKYHQESPLILVKTYKNNVAVITQTNGKIASEYSNQNGNVICLTHQSGTSTGFKFFKYAEIGDVNMNRLVIIPLVVEGDNDYCPYTYIPIMQPYQMAGESGGVIEIGNSKFYTNGAVYVKL